VTQGTVQFGPSEETTIVKVIYSIALVALIALVTFGSLMARTPDVDLVGQTWTGVISSRRLVNASTPIRFESRRSPS
jgi:hypothetical protein